MRVRVGCEFRHQSEIPLHAVLQVEPRPDGGFRMVHERWENAPEVPWSRYVDGFGNLCRRLTIPAGESVLRYDTEVEVTGIADPVVTDAEELLPGDLPDHALAFTLPSRFCPSDELGDMAWELFGGLPRGWSRVQAICDWTHEMIVFGYGSSSPRKTAAEVVADKRGVCRDYAHVAVTMCRALNIPARYAFGYLPDVDIEPTGAEMDFCAWMEVYLSGQWFTFDPRNNVPRAGRVLIGYGRDALDVAMLTTYGGPELLGMTVWADAVVGA
ncbi:MAG TPA: transglutaminase family protein [Acidimicrobiales bacterium]|nr:transglutaminase family protein [Acidimicrobiales bacterium]